MDEWDYALDPEKNAWLVRERGVSFEQIIAREEKKVIAAYERGEFKPVKDQEKAKRAAVQAAKRYTRKDARINIRLSSADLEMLKQRAVEEGLPYQSLIASVLHKYVSGSMVSEKRER